MTSTSPLVLPSPETIEIFAKSNQIAAELIRQGIPTNTLNAIKSDLRYFFSWHAISFNEDAEYPIPNEYIVSFVTDHTARWDETSKSWVYGMSKKVRKVLEDVGRKGHDSTGSKTTNQPHKISTIKRRLSSLARAHEVKGYSRDSVYSAKVKELLKAGKNIAYNKPRKKEALTIDLLYKLIDCCDNSLAGLRDRAILSVAFFSGGRRRSEIASMMSEQLTKDIDAKGDFCYLWNIPDMKRKNKASDDFIVPITRDAAVFLQEYLKMAKIESGAVFVKIDKHGKPGKQLSSTSINTIFKKLQTRAGLDEMDLSAHSIRAGFITTMGRENISSLEIMHMTGHRDHATFQGYYRGSNLLHNPVLDLLKR